MIGLLKTILFGRPKGLRRKVVSKIFTETEDTSPNSSFSAPEDSMDVEVPFVNSNLEPPRDVTPPEGYEVVLHKDSINDGEILEVIIAGTAIAIAQTDGQIYAFSNTCPHDVGDGGPLSEGTLIVGEDYTWVRSPYHGWDFDIRTGKCQTSPGLDLECYPTYIEANAICVKV